MFTATARPELSYRRLFAVPQFARIVATLTFGRIGLSMWNVGLILFVITEFRSPGLVGLAAFAAAAPEPLISPITGALLDRLGRGRLMAFNYAASAVCVTVLAALSLLHDLSPALLLGVTGLGAIAAPLHSTGMRSVFPLLVPEKLWDRANAVDSATEFVATLLGPLLAGFCMATVGDSAMLLTTAGFFVLAALAVERLREPAGIRGGGTTPLLADARAGMAYVFGNPTLRGLAAATAIRNTGGAMVPIAVSVLVVERFGSPPIVVGALFGLMGLCGMASGIVLGRRSTLERERSVLTRSALAGTVGLLLAATGNPSALVLGIALYGASDGIGAIVRMSLRQRRTDPLWIGRAFSISTSLHLTGYPVGSALAGPLSNRSTGWTLTVAAGLTLVAGVFAKVLIPAENEASA